MTANNNLLDSVVKAVSKPSSGSRRKSEKRPSSDPKKKGKTTRTGKKSKSKSGKGKGSQSVKGLVSQMTMNNSASQVGQVSSLAVDSYISSVSEGREDLTLMVSPYALFQFIYAHISGVLNETDRSQDSQLALKVSLYYFQKMQIADFDDLSWPRKLAEVWAALRPRKVGPYNYTPNWNLCAAALNAVLQPANNSAPQQPWFDSVGIPVFWFSGPASAPSGGYLALITGGQGAIASDAEVQAFTSQHYTALKMYPIDSALKDDNMKDASAFAWDSSFKVQTPNSVDTPKLVNIVGCTVSGTYWYCEQNSVALLETPIKRPNLAALRLTTLVPGNVNGGPAISPSRRPMFTLAVNATPGLLGYSAMYKKLGNIVQTKLVPSSATLDGIVKRLEYIGKNISGFTSTMAARDIQVLTYLIWKRHLRRYSGSEVGTLIFNPAIGASGAFTEAEPYGVHLDDTCVDTIKIPEPIQRFLGAQCAYADKKGTIVPFCARVIGGPPAVNTTLTYTGTAVNPAFPSGAFPNPTVESSRGLITNIQIVQKWKLLEANFAQYCNMLGSPNYGPSYLDTSLVLDTASNSLCGVVSRRPMTSYSYATILAMSGAMSYLSTANNANTTDAVQSINWQNHNYAQSHRRDAAGYDSYATLILSAVPDGFVLPGTSTSNLQPNYGPDNVSGDGTGSRPVPAPAGPPMALKAMFSPSWGKYCGAGYSAGEYGGNPMVSNGKYVVPPSSKEDALCKIHDEAYLAAAGNKAKEARADRAFYEGLDSLAAKGEISILGRLAKAYFNPANWLHAVKEEI